MNINEVVIDTKLNEDDNSYECGLRDVNENSFAHTKKLKMRKDNENKSDKWSEFNVENISREDLEYFINFFDKSTLELIIIADKKMKKLMNRKRK